MLSQALQADHQFMSQSRNNKFLPAEQLFFPALISQLHTQNSFWFEQYLLEIRNHSAFFQKAQKFKSEYEGVCLHPVDEHLFSVARQNLLVCSIYSYNKFQLVGTVYFPKTLLLTTIVLGTLFRIIHYFPQMVQISFTSLLNQKSNHITSHWSLSDIGIFFKSDGDSTIKMQCSLHDTG